MRFLYNISIRVYGAVLKLAAFGGNKKAVAWSSGRHAWQSGLQHKISERKGPWVWFHCASLGEFEQGRPLIEAYREKHPHKNILLTFFSPSGFEIRKNYNGVDAVMYLPLDTPKNARSFIRIVRPESVFFIKYEFWFNLLTELNRNKIPVYLVSSIFRKSHWFFKPFAYGFLNELKKVRHFFVQNEDSASILRSKGITGVTVSGDTRFDRVITVAGSANALEWTARWKGNRKLIVAGSTWPEDEKVLLTTFNALPDDFCLLLVPHEIGTSHLEDLRKSIRSFSTFEFFSESNGNIKPESRIVVVDKIGLLNKLYKYADFSYIGGGFGKGIHNVLEAAVYGMPVFFGPEHRKFKEALDLISIESATAIRSSKELTDAILALYNNDQTAHLRGERAGKYVLEQSGATIRIMNAI